MRELSVAEQRYQAVISDGVSGELDRALWRSPQGFEQCWMTRIDGVRRGNVGIADVTTDEVENLASLAAVAQCLADELSRLHDAPTAPPPLDGDACS